MIVNQLVTRINLMMAFVEFFRGTVSVGDRRACHFFRLQHQLLFLQSTVGFWPLYLFVLSSFLCLPFFSVSFN